MISVFGSTGFIGSNWINLYKKESYPEPRYSLSATYNDILYLRGTNSNYNIFSNPSLDVQTNLLLFTETIRNITPNHNFTLISSWFAEFPKGFYSITKLTQELLLESYCKTFSIPYKIIRLSNIIGKDPKASAKKNALEFLISKIKNNEDIKLYHGDNYRNFLDVETCCRAIKFVMDNGKNGETYNIGADQSHRMEDLLSYCIAKTGSKSIIKRIEMPKFHSLVQVPSYWMDTNKLRNLGFNNEIDIYEKLDKIL